MPSRRNKKKAQDANITLSFFNQSEPSTPSSRAEQSHSHGTKSETFTELNASAIVLEANMSALRETNINHLTGEEIEEVRKEIDRLPMISDPHRVVRELNLAERKIKETWKKIEQLIVRASFKMDSLDTAAEAYDAVWQWYGTDGEEGMATSAKAASDFTSIAGDATRSTADRTAAECDALNHNIESKIKLPLTSYLHQVRLFNLDKKLGCFIESSLKLTTQSERTIGEDNPMELLKSFCQKLNDPSKPTEPAPKSRQKQGEEKLSGLEALAQLQRNLKLANEELQNLKAINDTQDYEELPSVTPTLMYTNVPIPEDIPDHVRQRFSDAEFALEQVGDLLREVTGQQIKLSSTLLCWKGANHAVWELGKALRYEMIDFREYEYNRNTCCALISIIAQQEVKIVEFYSGKGAPDFPLAMREVFKLGLMSLEEFKKDWVGTLQGNSF